MEELNNPYYMYPGYPFSGYFETSHYNSELIRLKNYIVKLHSQINSKTILHISFGSAAEEHYNDMKKRNKINFQWQQLFPEHVQRAIYEHSDYKIINLIIGPSKDFNSDYTPVFIEKTPELEWYKDDSDKTFKSRNNDNIIVKIFNCPMPSKCDYTKVIKKLRDSSMYEDETMLDRMVQTPFDKTFISNFYSSLENLFEQINRYYGLITCFSYVVFNDDTEKRIYNNYYLFQEIKKLFEENYTTSKRVLAEWIYRMGFYSVVIYNTNNRENNLISYVKPQTLDIDDLEYYELDLYTFKIQKIKYKFIEKNKQNSLFESLNIFDVHKIKTIKNKIMDKLNDYEKKEGHSKIYDKNLVINKLEITFNNIDDKEKKLFLSNILSVNINSIIFNKLELDLISSILKKRIIVFNKNGIQMYDTSKDSYLNEIYENEILLEYDIKKMVYRMIKDSNYNENNYKEDNYCLKKY
jgi:hypothetical protein